MKQQKPLHEMYVVDEVSGCWNWNGCLTHNGYGQMTAAQRRWSAHRYFFVKYRGHIPPGMLVCHHCDNRKCVNPEHLFLGTFKDNTQDMMRKGRNKSPFKEICVRGHRMEGQNVYVSPKGKRNCRACQKERERKWRVKDVLQIL
jgi:hypothetical protein